VPQSAKPWRGAHSRLSGEPRFRLQNGAPLH